MDTVWTTVKVRRSTLEAAMALAPGASKSAVVQRALESVLNTSASSGGGPASAVIPGESGRGGGVGRRETRERDASSVDRVEPPSAPSRAPAEEEGGQASPRTASHGSSASARQVPAGPQASPPSDVSSSASQGREGEAGVNGGAGAAIPGQTTVDEMLASCPNCAGTFESYTAIEPGGEMVLRCMDCGYVREPS